MQPGQTLVLVDGSSLAFRAFYALFMSGLRRSRDSMATWAILGFLNSLFDLMEQRRPDGLAISFDMAAPTFRDELYAEYKANRGEMPDDLAVQWPLIKQVVEILNIPLYEVAGYEADDVIGTVARQAQQRGIKVQILTGDYDSFQLVDDAEDGIKVLVPVPKRHELLIYSRQQVFEKLGVWPEQVVDYKGFCGDTSDNIPGIKGVGPKTAVQLLTSWGSMDGVYEHIDEVKGALKQKLIDGKESAYASKHLATMRMDVPLDFDFEHCNLHMPKIEELGQFLHEMEFKQMIGRLPKILSRFSDTGEAPEIPASVMALAGTASGGAMSGGGGGGKLSRSAAKSGPRSSAPGAVAVIEPEIKLTTGPEPRVITTGEDLAALLREVERYPSLALDLEIQGGSPFNGEIGGYSLAWTQGLKLNEDGVLQMGGSAYSGSSWKVETAFIPVKNAGDASDYLPAELVHEKMKVLLENPTAARVIHNSKTIANALSLVGYGPLSLHFDPMLASYIVNPDDKHSLKDMAQRLLGYASVRSGEAAAGGKKQLTINFAAVDKIASCAADDARISLELARYYLDGRFDADQWYLLNEIDLPMSAVLARMEQAGVALDLPYLAGLSEELTRDLVRLEREIYDLAGHTFNINSTQQLQTVLFEELGLKTKGRTKSGSYSTDASVLESLRDAHPIVARILEYRQLSKLRSTYVDALPREVSHRDNRLHGEFNMTTTATGRLSSSNPNLQNIPIKTEVGRRIRRAFVPGDPDSLLLSADYSQIELRLLGHMSADDILRDAFEKDQDIHKRTAGEIFDTPFDQVSADQRRVGKTLNFALVYQQGAMATAQDLGISMKEAQAFIDKYFSRYPRVRGFIQRTIEEARGKGYVQTLWGRKRYFRHLNDRSDVVRKADERAAVNAPIQGSAADLMKLAMIRLDKELTKRKLKSKLILQVHDELVLEVPKAELEEATSVVRESMLMDQPFKVPLGVDVGVGPNWMDAK
jgi:DNA polymerase-1